VDECKPLPGAPSAIAIAIPISTADAATATVVHTPLLLAVVAFIQDFQCGFPQHQGLVGDVVCAVDDCDGWPPGA
jgi:hypothetical protein